MLTWRSNMTELNFTDRTKLMAHFFIWCEEHNYSFSIENLMTFLIVHSMIDIPATKKAITRLDRKRAKEVK